ncbi:MAG TPA: hypothetical protein VEW42_04920 [Candidatus Eisenbacteria bacterium]|nr:hypothetical protein [Candidatus Eisenbacteria bacterium]
MSVPLEIIFFLLFLAVGLYLPGRLFFSLLKIKLDSISSLFLPFAIGILLFALSALIVSSVHVPYLLLPLCLVASIYSLVREKPQHLSLPKNHFYGLGITMLLSLLFALFSFFTGIFPSASSGQVVLYRGDDLWHLMLINELAHTFPPNNPGFASIPLHGYHFFYDLLVAKVSTSFFVSPFSLYFRYFPLLLSFLWGVGVYAFIFMWSKKISISLWAVALTLFGGSFAYILSLQGHAGFSWDSALGMSQPASSLLNPPFTISIILLLAGLFCLLQYYSTKKFVWLFPFVLTVGLLPMFKVYAGILLMTSYALLVVTELIKRHFKILLTLPFVGILFLTYSVFALGGGFLIWYPLWSPHAILQSFPWYNFDNKMLVYGQQHVLKGLITTELDGLVLFIFGNVGTRIIGILLALYFVVRKRIAVSILTSHLLLLTLVSLCIPLLFIQSGKVFEIIQMGWYYLFFTAIFASFGLGYFLEKKIPFILKILFILLFVTTTIPSSLYALYKAREVASFESKNPIEKSALFLAKDSTYTHTILELPSQEFLGTVGKWYSNQLPILATFGKKNAYVTNEYINFPGVPINQRLTALQMVMEYSNAPTPEKAKDIQTFLKKNHIIYIYAPVKEDALLQIPGVQEVFTSTPSAVYLFTK